jgi:hypothetical protein
MSARSDARGDDQRYRDPAVGKPFSIGSTVRCAAGIGTIEFVAYSSAMNQHVYTVALDTRTKLRLVSRDVELLKEPT